MSKPSDGQKNIGIHVSSRSQGQQHDRIPGATSTVAMMGDDRGKEVEVEITAGQKMLSAMSGSLLTSLLGACGWTMQRYQADEIQVTPLDVVRVRLQSQKPPTPVNTSRAPVNISLRSFSTMHPSVGVTACCREVFFASNSGEQCLVSPKVTLTGECAVEETQKRTINSTMDGLRKIARNEGVRTLWRGLSPTLVMTIPANIIYFTGYDWLRFNRASPINAIFSDNYAPLIAGSTARIIAAGVVSPIEMFRTRMQASRSVGVSHFSETLQGLGSMVANHGYSSLWRGLTLTLWRDVPFSGIYWWGYETIRGALTEIRDGKHEQSTLRYRERGQARLRSQSHENHTATFVDSFVAGASSGAIASMVTTPFDVGKTRQQIFKDAHCGPPAANRVLAPEERSMPRFLWHIFKTEGLSGLWTGGTARVLKVAPACAIMISCYEVGKRTFRSVNERAERQKGLASEGI